jgi:tRNA modification GTPase
MFYNSVNMELVDSAGVRNTSDSIEAEGVALSSAEIQGSELILVVLDHSTEAHIESFKSMVLKRNHLMVFNKSDEKNPVEKYDCIVSAKSGKGVQELKKMIFDSIQQSKNSSKKTFIIRERHLVLFNTALSSLDDCIEKISNEKDVDVAAEDLRLVRSSFDEFLGVKYPDELLGDIFNDFCIGK